VATYQFGLLKRQACIPCRFLQVAEILVGEQVKDLTGMRLPDTREKGKYTVSGKGVIYRIMETMADHGRFHLEDIKGGGVISADLHGCDGRRFDFHKALDTGDRPIMYQAPEPDVHWKDKWRQVWEEKRTMHDGESLAC
jgi:hypothetical protein